MKKAWLISKLLYYVFRISRNPEDTAAALGIGPCLFRLGYVEQARKKLNENPADLELIRQRKLLNKIDLHELKKNPEGSLGYAFAHHMLRNKLDPEFYGKLNVSNDETYVMMRLRQTHDLWHVLAGFTTEVQDELGLQAFMFAQTRAPLASILIGGAFLKAGLTNHPLTALVYERVSYGWKLGNDAQSIFALDWEANWATPLTTLRAQYGLNVPSTAGGYLAAVPATELMA
tara:strand:- start:18279 stop:18971 length:693 start_codon:yes stop_codon:yes gene_type:complete